MFSQPYLERQNFSLQRAHKHREGQLGASIPLLELSELQPTSHHSEKVFLPLKSAGQALLQEGRAQQEKAGRTSSTLCMHMQACCAPTATYS